MNWRELQDRGVTVVVGEITEAQREELGRRLEMHRSSQERGSTWESIRDRLQAKE